MKAVFIGKEAILIHAASPEGRASFAPGAREGVRLLHSAGFALFIVANQPGIALGLLQEAEIRRGEWSLRGLMRELSVPLGGYYLCPHHPDGVVEPHRMVCDCRKPAPGLILRAQREHGIDLSMSWLVGDSLDDAETGKLAGTRTILLQGADKPRWPLSRYRQPDFTTSGFREAAELVIMRQHLPGGTWRNNPRHPGRTISYREGSQGYSGADESGGQAPTVSFA